MSAEHSATTQVDVIVPVYGNLPAVQRCLQSVLQADLRRLARLIVIDDASPDAQLRHYLDGLAASGAIELLRHEQNRGFVAAANAGMSASMRDVILLNSDTEVHADWIDRMLRCAYREARIGTVTPFSNNATICSYPWLGWEAGLPGGLSVAALDELFARENADASLELPTGIGFCLLIRRSCLDETGLFDEARFGRGYGEENDFCQRALRSGWRHLLCADTFVYHEGGASFAHERQARAEQAERLLAELHPAYASAVKRFILADGTRVYRERVDRARASLDASQIGAILEERSAEIKWILGWLAHVSAELDRATEARGQSGWRSWLGAIGRRA